MKYLLLVLLQVSSQGLAVECYQTTSGVPFSCIGRPGPVDQPYGHTYIYHFATEEYVNQIFTDLNNQMLNFPKSTALPAIAQEVSETLRIDQGATNQQISNLEAKNKSLGEKLEKLEKTCVKRWW